MGKLRVEMGVAIYEGDLPTWYTTYVEIPDTTPEDEIEKVARDKLMQRLYRQDKDGNVAATFLYAIDRED